MDNDEKVISRFLSFVSNKGIDRSENKPMDSEEFLDELRSLLDTAIKYENCILNMACINMSGNHDQKVRVEYNEIDKSRRMQHDSLISRAKMFNRITEPYGLVFIPPEYLEDRKLVAQYVFKFVHHMVATN